MTMIFRLLFVLFYLPSALGDGWSINGTGGAAIAKFVFGTTFIYQLEFQDTVTYDGDGAGVGVCNILGFWQSGNTNPAAPSAAIRATEQTLCGNPGEGHR